MTPHLPVHALGCWESLLAPLQAQVGLMAFLGLCGQGRLPRGTFAGGQEVVGRQGGWAPAQVQDPHVGYGKGQGERRLGQAPELLLLLPATLASRDPPTSCPRCGSTPQLTSASIRDLLRACFLPLPASPGATPSPCSSSHPVQWGLGARAPPGPLSWALAVVLPRKAGWP